MNLLANFFPLILFIVLYVGSGLYFLTLGIENAFYQIPSNVAILPALIAAWLLVKGNTEEKINRFLDGIGNRNIMTMCMMFLLAGAFGVVTKSIGCVDATVNLFLSWVPSQFLLIGLFIAAAFISTAIGTSMGTIATLAPVAAGLAAHGAFPVSLGMATVVGGAMWGDNLSLISDTTIVAVLSQGADARKKLKVNSIVAFIACIITIFLLSQIKNQGVMIELKPYSPLLLFPYVLLIGLAIWGVNVFVGLMVALGTAGLLGIGYADYSLLQWSHDIAQGFNSMHEIMLLSMLVGGLSGLASTGLAQLGIKLAQLAHQRMSRKLAQLLIAAMVSILDILLANNTVAILLSGKIAQDIAKRCKLAAHYSAAWLDVFSCVFQGILPYGAQILLASKVAGISPFEIAGQVYYCYVLGIVSVLYIVLKKEQHFAA